MNPALEEIEHIAELARLALTPSEKTRYPEQRSDILDYAARLQELDTTDIAPTAGFRPQDHSLRSDQPGDCLAPEDLLANAPQAEAGQLRVPPVLE